MILRGAEIPVMGPQRGAPQRDPGGTVPPAPLRDVRIEGGVVSRVAARIDPRPGETVIDAAGGALLPGLHDHHVHLLSMAARSRSVPCGPPEVRTRAALAGALRKAAARTRPGEWVRGVGYHESVAGDLGRSDLDSLVGDRPVRVQHRSGQLWMINSAGLRALGADGDGRLFRSDAWLRRRLGEHPGHGGLSRGGVAAASRALAAFGVTGLTDATFTNGRPELRLLREEAARGRLLQNALLMGSEHLLGESGPPGGKAGGPVVPAHLKVMLHDDDLPDPASLADRLRACHASGRRVAVHCVTRAELVVALEALRQAGGGRGDRIEHAGVAPDECLRSMRSLGLTVVTQPNFVAERGDAYASEVDAGDLGLLYRLASFDRAGVPVGGGTDAPFGRPDPWASMKAAVKRETAAGTVIGPGERVTPERALSLFTTPPGSPGGRPRSVGEGSRADLVLLSVPWREARQVLGSELVAATLIAGRLAHGPGRDRADDDHATFG